MTATAEALLARVEAFARDEVAPRAPGWSLGAAPEPATFAAAAALGLTAIEVPRAEGGLGLGFSVKARAAEILAAEDFGFAMAVVNTHNVAARIALSAAPQLRARHLPGLLSGRAAGCTALTEPGAGSDVGALATRSRRVTEGWRLTGEKTWIINARRAEVAILYAQCADPGDRDGVAAFVAPLAGATCTRRPLDSPFAQTSIGSGALAFEDHPIPAENLLLPPGEAFRAILSEINGARAYVAAMCCGMLGAAVEAARAYGEARRSFGRPLAGHQAWRLALAEATTELAAARALTREAVAAVEAGAPEAQILAAEAKVHATGVAVRRLPELMHLVGAEGLSPERPFARHLAAAQAATLTDGSTEMLLERVARLTALA